ncbi:hypothetical protein JZ751_008618 [Albula glossodonta]|uniref:Uncharacterized protein n=1 Tax=Albula glossodonta TaxID=121402 RepID=A0A8T2NZ84_9TELE|nr:hypothetical protein JZ751_008618 [Albula glossodonta]
MPSPTTCSASPQAFPPSGLMLLNPPHPYITVLENRPDCWPALLGEIDDIIKQALENWKPQTLAPTAPSEFIWTPQAPSPYIPL